jgi:hypothetical protein
MADSGKIRIEAIDKAGKAFDTFALKKGDQSEYRAKAVPLEKPMGYMRKKFAADFLRDEDELLDSIAFELDEEPQPGKDLKGRLVVRYNPFPAPLGFKASWVTDGTPWTITPRTIDLRVKPRSRGTAEFTYRAADGKKGGPKPVLKYVFSYGGKKGGGTYPVAELRKQKGPSCK